MTEDADAGAGASRDRNACRGQAPWSYRYKVISCSLLSAGALFAWALAAGQAEAFGPLAGFAGAVVSANVLGAVADDRWRPSGQSGAPR
ncbi:MAG: hypothetical protein KIS81_00720 [Maricaulaceae bacterium]|nr:hypothetical protein [Maricaulaceae bacterium]